MAKPAQLGTEGNPMPVAELVKRLTTEPRDMPEFPDQDVQVVYQTLCDTQDPWVYAGIEEHWEGRMARRIVQRLRAALAAKE